MGVTNLSLWMVRAGKHGAQEAIAIHNGIITIGWNDLPDLSSLKTKAELAKLYSKAYPEAKKKKAGNSVGQIWRFIHDIKSR